MNIFLQFLVYLLGISSPFLQVFTVVETDVDLIKEVRVFEIFLLFLIFNS